MKKLIILTFLITLLYPGMEIFANTGIKEISQIKIDFNKKQYSGDYIYSILDERIKQKYLGDNEKILQKYERISSKINEYLTKNKLSIKDKYRIENIQKIVKKGENKYKNIVFNTIKKIKLGESEDGKIIYGYYKGDPRKGFFGIFADIHGSYEYGTFNTANYLIEELQKSNKTGWFIIPTLNPSGLKYYKDQGKQHSFYIEGRDNINNVDLNRNFCTKNFKLKTFNKYGTLFKSGIGGCNSEKEVKTVINTLKNYNFNQIISLHSVGGNFFIPDNSFDDERVINLGNRFKEILKDYIFDVSYQNLDEKKHKIFEYEIDEGGSNKFTGTMETYIYETYNIPILIIELKEHGKIEYNLIGIIDLLTNNY